MFDIPAKFQQEWYEVARRYHDAPSFIDTPGRDLTPDQARDIFMHLVVNREIEPLQPGLFDSKGVRLPKPGDHFKISNNVGGVTFRHPTLKWDYLPNVNMAWAVVLWRFAMEIFMECGADVVYWGGIGLGRDDKPGDSHNTGRAIDFFGAKTRAGDIWVTEDWAKMPIKIGDKEYKDWPASQVPTYRLKPGDRGYELFSWVYRFAAREAQDYSQGGSIEGKAASAIGNRSFIIHPDHPDKVLRHHHQDHMHFQIGTT